MSRSKSQDGARQHQAGGKALDQRSDQDGSHALTGLVQSGEESDLGEGVRGGAGLQGIVIVSLGGQGGDGAVECLQAEFVQHNAGDVDDDIPLLLGAKGPPAVTNRHLWHGCRCGARRGLGVLSWR